MFRCIVIAPPCSDTSNAATLMVITGIDEPAKKPLFSVYPNPARDFIIMETTGNFVNGTCLLTDIYGRVLLSGIVASPQTKIEGNHLSQGICFFSIRSGSDQVQQTLKVVLQ